MTLDELISSIDERQTRYDKFRMWWIRRFVELNSYQVSGIFLFLLYAGARLDPNPRILLEIERNFPPFTPQMWEIVFLLSGLRIFTLKPGRMEVFWSILCFITPVTLFFVLLVHRSLTHPSMPISYFSVVFLVAALLVLIIFIARTGVLNYYRALSIKQELENRELRKRLANAATGTTDQQRDQ